MAALKTTILLGLIALVLHITILVEAQSRGGPYRKRQIEGFSLNVKKYADSDCHLSMPRESISRIHKAMFKKDTNTTESALVYMHLKFGADYSTKEFGLGPEKLNPHDDKLKGKNKYTDVSDISTWIWASDVQGIPVLANLDFRYGALSFGTLSLKTKAIQLYVGMPGKCFANLTTEARIGTIVEMFRDVYSNSSLLKIDIDSSVCYERVASSRSESSRYYQQVVCCQMTKYDNRPNPIRDTKEKHILSCSNYADDSTASQRESRFFWIMYIIMFLISPLMIKFFPKYNNYYLVDSKGSIAEFPPNQRDLVLTILQGRLSRAKSVKRRQKESAATALKEAVVAIEEENVGPEMVELEETNKTVKALVIGQATDDVVKDSDKNNTEETLSNEPDKGPVQIVREDSVPFLFSNQAPDDPNIKVLKKLSAGSMLKDLQEYLPLHSKTPIYITKPLHFIFFLQRRWINNKWICRFQFFLFFLFVYPAVLYALMLVDRIFYEKYIKGLFTIEQKMGITSKLSDLLLIDHVWSGHLFTNFYNNFLYFVYLLGLVMYVVMICMLGWTGNITSMYDSSMLNKEYLGFYELPPEMQAPPTKLYGFEKTYQKMKYRISLIADPKFWNFWFSLIKDSLCCPNGISLKAVLMVPIRLTMCIISLLFLIPLFNLLPINTLMVLIKHGHYDLVTDRVSKSCEGVRNVVLFVVKMVVSLMGIIFTGYIFLTSCSIILQVILYTIKGFTQHYEEILTRISTMLVGLYYVYDILGGLDSFYKNITITIFDECDQLDSENELFGRISESESLNKDKNDEDEAHDVIISENEEMNQRPIIVYLKNGIPLIPKELYDDIITRIVPPRIREFQAITKLTFLAVFLYYVSTVANIFSVDTSSIGLFLSTIIASALPKLFILLSSKDEITEIRLKYKIKEAVKSYQWTKSKK